MRNPLGMLFLAFLLLSCAEEAVVLEESPPQKPVVVTSVIERTTDISVLEDTVPTPLNDYSLTEQGLSFTNKLRQTFYADLERLHTKEAENRTQFIVNKGHGLLLDKGEQSFVVRYESIDTRKWEVVFVLMTEEETKIVSTYTPITTEAYPESNPEEYANSLTIGKGEIVISDYHFPYSVGNKAGNPLAVDLNGDYTVNGARVLVHSKSGEEHEVRGIQ